MIWTELAYRAVHKHDASILASSCIRTLFLLYLNTNVYDFMHHHTVVHATSGFAHDSSITEYVEV